MFKYAVAACMVAAATADHPAPHHAPAPAYKPAHPAPHYDESPKPYAFEYGVADDYSGANFHAAETADGKAVAGSYQVSLGRKSN